jgi:PKD repeat protein
VGETRGVMQRRWLQYIWCLVLFPALGFGQDCNIRSKANDINPDQFCSPVEVVTWAVTYVDVNDGGTLVEIHFDWDDGTTDTIAATEIDADTSIWRAIASHTYISIDNRCNYRPEATLLVDGVMCTSSSQEQIVTVWDNDNNNGGRVEASPDVFPICIGSGATMQFDDGTLFNCVPPQEEDVPNNRTRWIQWVYGTNSTMTGAPVMVDGIVRTYPYHGDVIELTGPVTESNENSLPITVANDKLIGQEFEVELRYWNYCNPYPTDPPETDHSVIRIVDMPDATISEVDTLCEFESNLLLTAATQGGSWSGNGIVNEATGEFSPLLAGVGTHIITYQVTDGNACSSMDTEDIVVRPGPDGTITAVDPFCTYDTPYDLEAATDQGTWSGNGIIDSSTGLFDPTVAGPGRQMISFKSSPDASGCVGADITELIVAEPPFAEFLTPDSAWCQTTDNQSIGDIVINGTDSSSFDLVIERQGARDTVRHLSNGLFSLQLNNGVGANHYHLVKIIEHQGITTCETNLFDTLTMVVHPLPELELKATYDDRCSPVEVDFEGVDGYDRYTWDFGDGHWQVTPTRQVSYTYFYDYSDVLQRSDTLFHIQLFAETDFGCRDTLRDSVRVYPNPEADFLVNPEIQNFPDSVFYLINLSSNGDWSYQWDFGDGTADTDRDPDQHIFDTWGIYDVELKTFSPYCRDSITKRVQIKPPSPRAAFQPDSVGCPPLDITFSNNSLYADSYLWDFDDGTYSTEASPTHRFWVSKEHHVILTAYGLSGVDSSEQTVLIHPRPRALFDAYPREARNLKQLIKFINNSINAIDYQWDFGDGNSSTDEHPSHVYREAGTYTVSLLVLSEKSCVDTMVQEKLITVLAGEGTTEFPNAFVWNGSGPTGGAWSETVLDNTVFHPHLENAVSMHMIIYTRWGEMIWETNHVYVGWDGYLKSGELVQPGVYVYKAWVTYNDGSEEELKGDITFLH